MDNVECIEEYDPQTNKWQEVGEFVKPIESDIEKLRKLNEPYPQIKKINSREGSKVIHPFTKSDIIREIEKKKAKFGDLVTCFELSGIIFSEKKLL